VKGATSARGGEQRLSVSVAIRVSWYGGLHEAFPAVR
jgi:hypothetical protein